MLILRRKLLGPVKVKLIHCFYDCKIWNKIYFLKLKWFVIGYEHRCIFLHKFEMFPKGSNLSQKASQLPGGNEGWKYHNSWEIFKSFTKNHFKIVHFLLNSCLQNGKIIKKLTKISVLEWNFYQIFMKITNFFKILKMFPRFPRFFKFLPDTQGSVKWEIYTGG